MKKCSKCGQDLTTHWKSIVEWSQHDIDFPGEGFLELLKDNITKEWSVCDNEKCKM
jgi:hypothetical protein